MKKGIVLKSILASSFCAAAFLSCMAFLGCGGAPELKDQIITQDFVFNRIADKEEYELVGTSLTYSQGENMVIPDMVEEYPVTKIGDFAFATSFNEQVGDSFEYYDFYDNENPDKFLSSKINISSLTIGNNIREIGRCAFACNELTSLYIPANVKEIGDNAFYENNKMATLTFADDAQIKSIGRFSFSDNGLLTSVTIPSSMELIGRYAFIDCEKLATITFESNSKLKEIGGHAFESTAVKTVVVPDSVEVMGKAVFQHCQKLENVTLSKNISEINIQMFYNTPALKKITIPANVKYIRNAAFTNSYSYNASNPIPTKSTLEEVVFESGSKLVEIGDSVFQGCTYLSKINLDACKDLKFIGEKAFYDVCSLEEVSISANVETIGNLAFAINDLNENESVLESIVIEKADGVSKLKTIGNSAFYKLSKLKDIDLTPCNSLERIGDAAFKFCSSLEEIFIPASVKVIGSNDSSVFYDTNISKVVVGSFANFLKISFADNLYANPVYEGKYLYTRGEYNETDGTYNDVLLTDADLSNSGIVELPNRILYNCLSIERIILPETLTKIGREAFKNCENLESIVIPSAVEEIGERAFETAFTETTGQTVSFGKNSKLKTIEIATFYNCSTLAKIDLTNCSSLEEIKTQSFGGTLGINEIVIPRSVKTIGTDSFNLNSTLNVTTFYRTGINKIIIEDAEAFFNIEFGNNYSNPMRACISNTSTAEHVIKKTMWIREWDNDGETYQDKELTDINLRDSGITEFDNYIMYCNTSLRTITLPKTITTIGNYAFNECANLSTISFPSSIEKVGYQCFGGSGLTNITFEGVDASGETWYGYQNNVLAADKEMEWKVLNDSSTSNTANNKSMFRNNGAYAWYKERQISVAE